MRHQRMRPELRERAEIFSLRLSPRLNKRSRCEHPASRADQAKPPQGKLDVLHQTTSPLQRIGRAKKAFMLSVHNEPRRAVAAVLFGSPTILGLPGATGA